MLRALPLASPASASPEDHSRSCCPTADMDGTPTTSPSVGKRDSTFSLTSRTKRPFSGQGATASPRASAKLGDNEKSCTPMSKCKDGSSLPPGPANLVQSLPPTPRDSWIKVTAAPPRLNVPAQARPAGPPPITQKKAVAVEIVNPVSPAWDDSWK
eukprot:CAMPEP_0172695998 /NCGR_PEP_ID=MMETSP1074-20121228/27739_1 /TAXON_ID=2916 /ORGANISM="Ceratium fusus, Strain PA161109" /LENGTH=155 /DNA_ID=CAMNT_0013516683 /DNA_START=371 /DNA_END=839 /DNA_ORIENTATION=-